MQYIDKTESLEKGIVVFPFIYIMGASATGKTVAIWKLCENHPEVDVHMVDLEHGRGEQMSAEEASELLAWARCQMDQRPFWLVFENVPKKSVIYEKLVRFEKNIPNQGRVILAGRENIPEELLELLWNRKLELIPQAALEFTREDTKKLKEMWQSTLNPDDVWRCTGGWAGCIDVLFRTSVGKHRLAMSEMSIDTMMKRHEIVAYINKNIVGELPLEEQKCFEAIRQCPWVDTEFCQEVLGIEDAGEMLESMNRRGFLEFDSKKMRWKEAPLFENCVSLVGVDVLKMGEWYAEHGFIKEALECYENSSNEDIYRECIIQYYYQIPFLDDFINKSQWYGEMPQNMYLRGMRKFYQQDFEGVKAEIRNILLCDMDEFQRREMLLNLYYVLPEISLDEWIGMVEKAMQAHKDRTFRLYNMIGNSCTYLCGFRDLSGMFACTKKEEARKAKIWKKAFGNLEWKCYQLAQMDYYMEIQRLESVGDDEWALLQDNELSPAVQMYLLSKAYQLLEDEECAEQFRIESNETLRWDAGIQRKVAEAIINIHIPWLNESENLIRWLKRCEAEGRVQINEKTYMVVWCMAKGYLLLNQYKKAEKLLKRLIPYLKTYHRSRFLAEALFEHAIISWETGHRGLALQSIIESFYISAEARYVVLYSNYGKRAKEVLEAYEEWHRQAFPESWKHKKKYPYGNVLRMPVSDYISVILRDVRRKSRNIQSYQMRHEELIEEHLTMMETLILQEIGRGLSNAEICAEQNLKLSTVKTHIYSLYKKLGVNSRVQATIKGKELGLLE